jgi:HlyD family secretion protein
MNTHRMTRVALVAATTFVGCNRQRQPDAYGNMEATEVVVGAQATGQLDVFVPVEGQVVASGALTGVVDTTALALQLAQVAAQRSAGVSRVGEVEKQIGVLETQRAIASRAYERTKRLFDRQAATAQSLDQAERDYKTLIAQIDASRAQAKTAVQDIAATDARAAQIREQMSKARVINPVGGTVLATYVKAGEVVQPGQPLYRIANLDTLELRAYFSEAQLSQVKLGQLVRVSVDAANGSRQVLPGTVSWVSSQAEFTPTPIQTRDERSNLVYAVKVRVANRAGVLKIGMPADVELPTVVARK